MKQMQINNTNDDDWGFYIDIEKDNSHNLRIVDNSLHRRPEKKIPDVIIPDSSYCIDIYDFNGKTKYNNNYYYDNIYYDSMYDDSYNLYNNIYYVLEDYKNKFDTKKVTNMIIKVSSTTFATIAVSCILLSIL